MKLHKMGLHTSVQSQHHSQNLIAFTVGSAQYAAIMDQGDLAKEILACARAPIEGRQKPEVARCGRKSGGVEIKEIFYCGGKLVLKICRT